MRPLESFSIFCAQGVTQCFIGLATGGRNECTLSVTSWAPAGIAAAAKPSAKIVVTAVPRALAIVASPLVEWGIAHGIVAASRSEGNRAMAQPGQAENRTLSQIATATRAYAAN